MSLEIQGSYTGFLLLWSNPVVSTTVLAHPHRLKAHLGGRRVRSG